MPKVESERAEYADEGIVGLKGLALLPAWHHRGFIEAPKTLVTTRRAYGERLHN
ncbi:hypothetical protein [Pseudomonas syringae]|uniref:hypothetical protein n=1 Tax=Pseudomonas syringae TaxID=317 RepID=UPI00041F6DD1|nr:hypothetical protein [Pseudomonas syringae]QGG73900.1 hypothetical protein N028_00215 [Pseudomonas syringae USA011]